MSLLLAMAVASCFTTNIEAFKGDAEIACKVENVKTVEVTGEYPGDVTVIVTYDFDLGANGVRQIAGTHEAMVAYRAAVASNVGMRKLHPKVRDYTLVMKDLKGTLCTFVFVPSNELTKSATCVTYVGGAP